MIDAGKRKAIVFLHEEGMSLREISRRLGVSRGAVRAVLSHRGEAPRKPRSDKAALDEELLRSLHKECDGRAQRMHEKLVEEHGAGISYSTLTHRLRELEIGKPRRLRCESVPDQPGEEMQHDTTIYQVALGGKRTRLVCSLLYLRYSKRRYLRFYRSFNRFRMKCFLHEALMYWGFAAGRCVIDNTNLARLRGTGKDAVIVPEMEAFARQYGFRFICHEIGHANRKAGEERSFWTVETNFLVGRTFESLEDINAQAFEWATVRLEHRPQGKARLIPAKAFEHEQDYLIKLPPHLPRPYEVHERLTDQYGYIAFEGNYYWVPGTRRDRLKVLQYADRLELYRQTERLAEYALPADGVKNRRFSPPGFPKPRGGPAHRKKPAKEEEKKLRALGEEIAAYVDFILQAEGVVQRQHFIRRLYALSRRTSPGLFLRAVGRAHKYRITNAAAVERIAALSVLQDCEEAPWPPVDESFSNRPAYQEGLVTDEPDLTIYNDPHPDEEKRDG